MANGVINLTSNRDVLEGRIVWSSSSNGSTANTSNVYADMQVRRNDGYATKGTWTGTLNINEDKREFSNSSTSVGSNWVSMKSFTFNNKAHNSDGSGTCWISGWVDGPSGTSMEGYGVEGGTTVTLDKIPRYLTITGHSLRTKTINSISINWTTDVARDYTQYSLNGGAWTDAADVVNNNNNKSGYYTISNLSANTTYTIKTRLRRSDSGLYTESSTLTVTTYDYAKLVTVPNINIGASHTITWTNPAGASISLKLCKTDNTSIIDYGTVTGTSKSITPTASTIYALTPNSNTYKARYVLTTTQNSKTYTNYKDFTFTVTNSNPTFSSFTYVDSNSTTTALTGNNQKLIRYYSGVKATISVANRAVAKNSATMKKYKLIVGNKTSSEVAYSSTADVNLSVSNIENNVLTVYATDSRANSTAKSITLDSTKYITYNKIAINAITLERSSGGIGTETTLSYNGTFWNGNFGAKSNSITSIKYYYRQVGTSTWYTGGTTLSPTKSGNSFSQSVVIQGDLAGSGFDANKSFEIKLVVFDELMKSETSTNAKKTTLRAGTPLVAYYKDGLAIGQKYDTSVNAKLQVAGGVNIPNGSSTEPYNSYQIGGEPVMRNTGDGTIISSKGSIYLRPNGTTDTTGQVLIDTNGNVTAPKFNGEVIPSTYLKMDGTNYSFELTGGDGNTTGYRVVLQQQLVVWGNYRMTLLVSSRHTGAGLISLGISVNGTLDNYSVDGRYYGELTQFSNNSWIQCYNPSTGVYTLLWKYADYTNCSVSVLRRTLFASLSNGTWITSISSNYGTQYLLKSAFPTTLYTNSSGTTGTITLSETSANFNYLEVYYALTTDSGYSCSKVQSPNGKKANLQIVNGIATNNISIAGCTISISGTSVTFSAGKTIAIASGFTLNGFSNTNEIKIYKILGYR